MLFDRIKNIVRSQIGDKLEGNSLKNIFGEGESMDYDEIQIEYERIKRERELREKRNQQQQQQYHQTNSFIDKERQYYADLELPSGASFEDIKKSYKRLMKQYHPDRFINDRTKYDSAVKLAARLNEAYSYFETKYKV
jgi:DnaJ-domain-containing protein 1